MRNFKLLLDKLFNTSFSLPVTQDGDPRYMHVIRLAEAEAEAELADVPKGLGFCHRFWGAKKHILRVRYGLNWKSPAEIHPAKYD